LIILYSATDPDPVDDQEVRAAVVAITIQDLAQETIIVDQIDARDLLQTEHQVAIHLAEVVLTDPEGTTIARKTVV